MEHMLHEGLGGSIACWETYVSQSSGSVNFAPVEFLWLTINFLWRMVTGFLASGQALPNTSFNWHHKDPLQVGKMHILVLKLGLTMPSAWPWTSDPLTSGSQGLWLQICITMLMFRHLNSKLSFSWGLSLERSFFSFLSFRNWSYTLHGKSLLRLSKLQLLKVGYLGEFGKCPSIFRLCQWRS